MKSIEKNVSSWNYQQLFSIEDGVVSVETD